METIIIKKQFRMSSSKIHKLIAPKEMKRGFKPNAAHLDSFIDDFDEKTFQSATRTANLLSLIKDQLADRF